MAGILPDGSGLETSFTGGGPPQPVRNARASVAAPATAPRARRIRREVVKRSILRRIAEPMVGAPQAGSHVAAPPASVGNGTPRIVAGKWVPSDKSRGGLKQKRGRPSRVRGPAAGPTRAACRRHYGAVGRWRLVVP